MACPSPAVCDCASAQSTAGRIPSVLVVIGVALVAALIFRHSGSRGELRTLVLLGGLALGLRLAAVAVVWVVATRVHAEGVWLNDEASYFLATESLMPWPWDRVLPQGLDHLAGNGYLGLTTTISLFVGSVDSLAFRDANAIFGTIVVLLCAWLAQSFFGRSAGLLAGLSAALWPDLVLWSATMLRDTLCSLAVVGVWWALQTATRERRVLTTCFVALALLLVWTLRPYLAGAVAVGSLAWLVYPFVRRQRARTFVVAAMAVLVVGVGFSATQARRLDEMEHELFYRQTVTRMETLGRLYAEKPPLDEPMQLPFRPGAAIAIPDPTTGWLLAGVVENSIQPGFIQVGLTDDTSRTVPIGDVVLLQDAHIPPLQLFSWVVPSLLAVFAGLPGTSAEANVAWIAAAVAWDVLLLFGVVGLVRGRLNLRDWLYPAVVILGTLGALTAIPGAPGNAERHRATQTVPVLLVFASGIVCSRARLRALAGGVTSSPTSMPTSATTAVASSSRSAW
jgi:hypothetical protein